MIIFLVNLNLLKILVQTNLNNIHQKLKWNAKQEIPTIELNNIIPV